MGPNNDLSLWFTKHGPPSPENLSYRQILGPHPTPTESETVGRELESVCFQGPPIGFNVGWIPRSTTLSSEGQLMEKPWSECFESHLCFKHLASGYWCNK